MKHWPFEIVEAGKKPKIQVEFKCEKKTFTPEEVSSMVSFEQIPDFYNKIQRKYVSIILGQLWFVGSQRPRIDLNKRFLPRPKTITA